MSDKEDRSKQDQPSKEPKPHPTSKPDLTDTAPSFGLIQSHFDLDKLRSGRPVTPHDAIKFSPEKPDPKVQAPDFASVLKDHAATPNSSVKAPEFTSKLASDTPTIPPQNKDKEADPK